MSMPLMGVPDKKQRKFNIYTIEECGHGSKDKNGKFEKGTKSEGEFKFEKGTKYEGEFKDGKRHGQGILKDSDGKIIYEGEWKDDKPDGKGTITIPDSACKKSIKRKFVKGDYVHKIIDECKECKNNKIITMIFAEEEKS